MIYFQGNSLVKFEQKIGLLRTNYHLTRSRQKIGLLRINYHLTRSRQKIGLPRIIMENLKTLKSERKKLIKEIEKLKNRLYEVDEKIAKYEGTSKELESIRIESEDFTKDMKDRPKPNYKRNLDFNEEYEDRISKRQKRIGKEKIITPEIIEDSEFEDEQQEIS